MRKKKLHEELKNFLVELGKKKGYRSFSGDSECLDIRIKKKRIEYKPDVIWKTNNSYYIFEFAFTEDWRAVIGEFILAWLKEDCSKFFVFRFVKSQEELDSEYYLLNNLFVILGKTFKKIGWNFYILTKEDEKNFEKTKKKIRKELRECNYIR